MSTRGDSLDARLSAAGSWLKPRITGGRGVVDYDEGSGALRHEERAVGVASEVAALQHQAALLQYARAHLVVLDLAARAGRGQKEMVRACR